MVKKKLDKGKAKPLSSVSDYRYENATRVNIPPAKIAAEGAIPKVSEAQYSYSPRRPPTLRFDQHGRPDKLLDLLEQARQRALTDEETKRLAEAVRTHEPWLALDLVVSRVAIDALAELVGRHEVHQLSEHRPASIHGSSSRVKMREYDSGRVVRSNR